jgi:hypothetical protein
MRTFIHPSGQKQCLAVADLLVNNNALDECDLMPTVVYSDPPWNPGNEKWWRRYANKNEPDGYQNFLVAWCISVARYSPQHVFCEQSINEQHRKMMTDEIERHIDLPYQNMFIIEYGSPKRKNVLLHYGITPIDTDPSGLSKDKLVITALSGLRLEKHSTIYDPCIGLGTTSRVTHKMGYNCIGTELNTTRLEKTISWLIKHGYKEIK